MEQKVDTNVLNPEEPRQMKVPGPDTHLGKHIVAEFFLADFDALNEADKVEEAMREAAKIAGATILSSHNHFFSPHGVSAVVIV